MWSRYWASFWEVTQCQWQKRFDPTYDTYGPDGLNTGHYDYEARRTVPGVEEALAAVATTGRIKRPLVSIAGTMDALLPVVTHARPYEALVNASRKGNDAHRHAQFRLYEVQNGNHIETYRNFHPDLQYLQPHAHRAFDLLVRHVEERAALPPSQCIPHGGAISATPSQPGHCAELFVPTPKP